MSDTVEHLSFDFVCLKKNIVSKIPGSILKHIFPTAETSHLYIPHFAAALVKNLAWGFDFILTLLRFDLRQGHEKLRELAEVMSGQGIFSEDFNLGLGDFLEIENDDPPRPPGDGTPRDDPEPPPQKKKSDPFPSIDGEMTASQLVERYKKTLLAKQSVHKDLFTKWSEANPATGENLAWH